MSPAKAGGSLAGDTQGERPGSGGAAAAKLMFRRRVSGTSIADVRAAAGVSSSQVYHYFKDKEALVAAVIEYQNEDHRRSRNRAGQRWTAWRACGHGGNPGQHQEELDAAGGLPDRIEGSESPQTDNRPARRSPQASPAWEQGIRSGRA